MVQTSLHFLSVMPARCFLFLCVFCALWVSLCNGACAEVDSDTQAVVGQGFKLGCISCKIRGEVKASAIADWHFVVQGETKSAHIYTYDGEKPIVIDDRFEDRLDWNGSKNTRDLQDASIYIHNVTLNDSGQYQCSIRRTLLYDSYEYEMIVNRTVQFIVLAKAKRGTASIVSEVMMYVSIIGLQLWLLVEMIYCYRKIAAAGDEALRVSAEEYLAIASESKDNCTGVQVAE